jgi:hypothetical protein
LETSIDPIRRNMRSVVTCNAHVGGVGRLAEEEAEDLYSLYLDLDRSYYYYYYYYRECSDEWTDRMIRWRMVVWSFLQYRLDRLPYQIQSQSGNDGASRCC